MISHSRIDPNHTSSMKDAITIKAIYYNFARLQLNCLFMSLYISANFSSPVGHISAPRKFSLLLQEPHLPEKVGTMKFCNAGKPKILYQMSARTQHLAPALKRSFQTCVPMPCFSVCTDPACFIVKMLTTRCYTTKVMKFFSPKLLKLFPPN